MKTLLISMLIIGIYLIPIHSIGQEGHTDANREIEIEKIDEPKGFRIKKTGSDYIIYADNQLNPEVEDYRLINHQVYFRTVNTETKDINGKVYHLINIPGNIHIIDSDKIDPAKEFPFSGTLVSQKDYGKNFWIEEEVIETETNTEYFKYANQVFSGLLTAPFKYRLKVGNAPESIIDGDFNIAPFFGWKWRLSTQNPYYIAPFVFTGITTLNYNSANNNAITDESALENGTGITYGAGISIRVGNVSPGFILGFDHSSGNLGNSFIYKDKAWISFSVNYDFFKPKLSDEPEKN